MNDSTYYDAELADPAVSYAGHYENDGSAAVAARAARATLGGNRHMNRTARKRLPGIRLAGLSERTGKPATWTTQAVLDAIHGGQIRAELLEDCEFWTAKAAQLEREAG